MKTTVNISVFLEKAVLFFMKWAGRVISSWSLTCGHHMTCHSFIHNVPHVFLFDRSHCYTLCYAVRKKCIIRTKMVIAARNVDQVCGYNK